MILRQTSSILSELVFLQVGKRQLFEKESVWLQNIIQTIDLKVKIYCLYTKLVRRCLIVHFADTLCKLDK